MAHERNSSKSSISWGASIWPLITGLAVGFLVGRETSGGAGTRAEAGGREAPAPTAAAATVPAGTKMPAKIYKSQTEFPSGWTKEADLASVTSISLAGLSDAQKTTALQAMNERDCECGCGMGKIGTCLKKDPNCPRSPNLAKLAVEMSK